MSEGWYLAIYLAGFILTDIAGAVFLVIEDDMDVFTAALLAALLSLVWPLVWMLVLICIPVTLIVERIKR